MDNGLKNKLIVVTVVLGIAIGFYFVASPYQNCLRDGRANPIICARYAAW